MLKAAVTIVICGVASSGAIAQSSGNAPVASLRPSAVVRSVEGLGLQAPAVKQKNPTLAGLLSFVVPGLGSFYAGNPKAGAFHLVVHALSYALIVGAAIDCENHPCEMSAATGAGVLVMLANDVVSIFKAAGDAHAYNARMAGRP
jgi:hypothetical protein